MSLFTSSSRKIFTKILLAIVLGMGTAMAIIRFITYLNDASAETILARVVEARAALPEIVKEDQNLVMAFGSSMTRAGFSPRQFDREVKELGKDVKSFNFGFGGLNPYFQEYLSRRIKESFEAKDKNLKLAVIEFNPFQTTLIRWHGAESLVDSFLTMLANERELLKLTLEDPERGIRLFTIKYIRNDISAEMITSFYGRELFPPERPGSLKEPESIVKKRNEINKELNKLFETEYPDYDGENWHMGWQGGGTIPEERSARTLELFEEYFQHLRSEERLHNDRQRRIFSADIEALNFEPILVESFINIIKNFQQFSDKVEVVMLPRNTRWINYSMETRERLNKAIRAIETATGVSIRDHQELPEITPEMFSDTTHLARYSGDVAYTHFLVGEYFKEL